VLDRAGCFNNESQGLNRQSCSYSCSAEGGTRTQPKAVLVLSRRRYSYSNRHDISCKTERAGRLITALNRWAASSVFQPADFEDEYE